MTAVTMLRRAILGLLSMAALAVMPACVVDAPPEDGVEVLEFEPGRAVLRFGVVQPAALIEGYIRGSALIYGATITSYEHERRVADDGKEYHFFTTTWVDEAQGS